MKSLFYILLLCLVLNSCNKYKTSNDHGDPTVLSNQGDSIINRYARGFVIKSKQTGYQLSINQPWNGAQQQHQFELINKTAVSDIDRTLKTNQIAILITRLVASSTTHITPLVMLNEQKSLIGFPGTDYISNASIRRLIDSGHITDLGSNESMSIERIITLQPDLVMGFGIQGANPIYSQLSKANIPVIYNGEWLEDHPLGKAEWIKLYGVLYGKEQQANLIFNDIEQRFWDAAQLIKSTAKPKVIIGACWKDTWYLPYGNSWQAQIIKYAHGDYVYHNTNGNGSLAYNIERVLTDAHDVDIWIAPGQYTSYSDLLLDQKAYARFKSFKNKQIYTFALNKGERGGMTYYEEASMRPDLVLLDLIKILHPGTLPDHELYFFKPLRD